MLQLTPQEKPAVVVVMENGLTPVTTRHNVVKNVAFAIVNRMDYLLTWDCTHFANATLQKTLFEYCTYHLIHMPVICTPELLTKPQL